MKTSTKTLGMKAVRAQLAKHLGCGLTKKEQDTQLAEQYGFDANEVRKAMVRLSRCKTMDSLIDKLEEMCVWFPL